MRKFLQNRFRFCFQSSIHCQRWLCVDGTIIKIPSEIFPSLQFLLMRIIAYFQFKSEKCLGDLMVVVWPHLLEIKVSFNATRWIWILKLPNNKFLNIKMFINCILFVGIDCIWGSRSQRKVWKTWSFATQSKISGTRNQLAPRTSVKIWKLSDLQCLNQIIF